MQQHSVNREEVTEGEGGGSEEDQESFHITSGGWGVHHVGMRLWTRAPQLPLNKPADSTVNLLITESAAAPPVLLFKWRHMTLSCLLPSPHLCASYWPPAHSSLPPSLRAQRQNLTHTPTGP